MDKLDLEITMLWLWLAEFKKKVGKRDKGKKYFHPHFKQEFVARR